MIAWHPDKGPFFRKAFETKPGRRFAGDWSHQPNIQCPGKQSLQLLRRVDFRQRHFYLRVFGPKSLKPPRHPLMTLRSNEPDCQRAVFSLADSSGLTRRVLD